MSDGPKPPRGISSDQASTAEDSLAGLETALSKLDQTGKLTKAAADNISKALATFNNEARKGKTATDVLMNSWGALKKRTGEYDKALMALGNSMEEQTGVLTEASEQQLRARKKGLEDMLKDEKVTGTLRAQVGRMRFTSEMDTYEKMAGKHKGLSQAAMYSGNKTKAVGHALKSMSLSAGQGLGRLGSFIGMTAKAMGGLAMVGGALVALFAISKRAAEATKDATGMGMRFYGVGDAIAQSTKMSIEARKQILSLPGVGSDVLIKGLTEVNKDYGFGLVASGKAYMVAKEAGASHRNDLITGGLKLVADAHRIGTSFGMSLSETMQGINRIQKEAKFSKAGEATKMFGFLAEEASRLQVPLEGLMEVFSDLAKSAEVSGASGDKLKAQYFALEGAASSLAGGAFFKVMDPEKMKSTMKAMSGLLTSIDPYRVAALTQGKGGAFTALYAAQTDRLGGGLNFLEAARKQSPDMDSALSSLVDAKGNILDPKNEAQATALAWLSTVTGGDASDFARGKMALSASTRTGRFDANEFARLRGGEMDEKIKNAKSVGTFVASGGDPLMIMVTYLLEIKNGILDMVGMMGASWFFKDGKAKSPAKTIEVPAWGGQGGYGQNLRASRPRVSS